MMYVCKTCQKEFESNRKRKNCFDCIPRKDDSLSLEEKDKRRKQSNVKKVQKRRDKIKLMSIEYKGGQCQICNYNKCKQALEFHHIDPNEKDFGISMKGYTRAWEKVKQELDKCILVCANCHREIHNL